MFTAKEKMALRQIAAGFNMSVETVLRNLAMWNLCLDPGKATFKGFDPEAEWQFLELPILTRELAVDIQQKAYDVNDYESLCI